MEGIDLGSAKKDLNKTLTVTAVNTALASSEQEFNKRDKKPLLPNSFLVNRGTSEISSTHKVPPLSTSFNIDTGTDSLQGSHLETCKKGMIEPDLNGEIPIADGAEETPATKAVDFRSDIKPKTIGLLELSPRISSARAVYKDGKVLAASELGFERENWVWWYLRTGTEGSNSGFWFDPNTRDLTQHS